MFKPLPQETTGTITVAASRIASTLTVNAALYDIIAQTIVGGHWTYLYIKQNGNIEVVRVNDVIGLNRIIVMRGQEGTRREAVLAGASVYYSLCLSAVYDQVREQVSPVTLTATGEANVNPIY